MAKLHRVALHQNLNILIRKAVSLATPRTVAVSRVTLTLITTAMSSPPSSNGVRVPGIAGLSGLSVRLNFLDFLDTRNRDKRFKEFGMINDPGCKRATKPDPYGLWLDECEDPYSGGIMGLRLFPNPSFDHAKWDANKYLKGDVWIEPPYLTGMSCGFCHIAFNPVYPPADPNNPKWENLAGAFGNQYFNEGALFGMYLKEDDFVHWVYKEQQPGTSDTSRISRDFIDNPNAVNAIFYIISARPTYKEVMNDGTE